MSEVPSYRGTLEGHGNWVTALATTPQYPDMLVSASRDKTILVWKLTREAQYGYAKKSLHGHNHFVSDIAISAEGSYCISSSWDKTLRLWDLETGETRRRFVGHDADVLSVTFSPSNKVILSASRDKSIKLWNTIGECKDTIKDAHTEWVSSVRCSPNMKNEAFVTSGWDKLLKVWDIKTGKLKTKHMGHTGYVNTVTISPDGSLFASGGKDGTTMLWDLNEGKHLYSLDAHDPINALCFAPNRYWLCAATDKCIIIHDLETKRIVDELKPEAAEGEAIPRPTCLTWSADGRTLFAGYTDNKIRVWEITGA